MNSLQTINLSGLRLPSSQLDLKSERTSDPLQEFLTGFSTLWTMPESAYYEYLGEHEKAQEIRQKSAGKGAAHFIGSALGAGLPSAAALAATVLSGGSVSAATIPILAYYMGLGGAGGLSKVKEAEKQGKELTPAEKALMVGGYAAIEGGSEALGALPVFGILKRGVPKGKLAQLALAGLGMSTIEGLEEVGGQGATTALTNLVLGEHTPIYSGMPEAFAGGFIGALPLIPFVGRHAAGYSTGELDAIQHPMHVQKEANEETILPKEPTPLELIDRYIWQANDIYHKGEGEVAGLAGNIASLIEDYEAGYLKNKFANDPEHLMFGRDLYGLGDYLLKVARLGPTDLQEGSITTRPSFKPQKAKPAEAKPAEAKAPVEGGEEKRLRLTIKEIADQTGLSMLEVFNRMEGVERAGEGKLLPSSKTHPGHYYEISKGALEGMKVEPGAVKVHPAEEFLQKGAKPDIVTNEKNELQYDEKGFPISFSVVGTNLTFAFSPEGILTAEGSKIANRLKKQFPYMKVQVKPELHYRGRGMSDILAGRAYLNIVELSAKHATLGTIPHEFFHLSLHLFGESPIVAKGMEAAAEWAKETGYIRGTEEALADMVGDYYANRLTAPWHNRIRYWLEEFVLFIKRATRTMTQQDLMKAVGIEFYRGGEKGRALPLKYNEWRTGAVMAWASAFESNNITVDDMHYSGQSVVWPTGHPEYATLIPSDVRNSLGPRLRSAVESQLGWEGTPGIKLEILRQQMATTGPGVIPTTLKSLYLIDEKIPGDYISVKKSVIKGLSKELKGPEIDILNATAEMFQNQRVPKDVFKQAMLNALVPITAKEQNDPHLRSTVPGGEAERVMLFTVDAPVIGRAEHFPPKGGKSVIGHVRWDTSMEALNVMRVKEIQSDLFQQGKEWPLVDGRPSDIQKQMEREVEKYEKMKLSIEDGDFEIGLRFGLDLPSFSVTTPEGQVSFQDPELLDLVDKDNYNLQYLKHWEQTKVEHCILRALNDKMVYNQKRLQPLEVERIKAFNRYESILQGLRGSYNDYFVRVLFKKASEMGFTKVQFPTPETVSKVEGFDRLEQEVVVRENAISQTKVFLEEIAKGNYQLKRSGSDRWSLLVNGILVSSFSGPTDTANSYLLDQAKGRLLEDMEELRIDIQDFKADARKNALIAHKYASTSKGGILKAIKTTTGLDPTQYIEEDQHGNEWYGIPVEGRRYEGPVVQFQVLSNLDALRHLMERSERKHLGDEILKKIGGPESGLSESIGVVKDIGALREYILTMMYTVRNQPKVVQDVFAHVLEQSMLAADRTRADLAEMQSTIPKGTIAREQVADVAKILLTGTPEEIDSIKVSNPKVYKAAVTVNNIFTRFKGNIQDLLRWKAKHDVPTQLYNYFLQVVDGGLDIKSIKDITPKEMKWLKSLVTEYNNVSNWGVDNYLTQVELGSYIIRTPEGHVVTVGTTKAIAIDKAKQWLEERPGHTLVLDQKPLFDLSTTAAGMNPSQYYPLKRMLEKALGAQADGMLEAIGTGIKIAKGGVPYKFSRALMGREEEGLKGMKNIYDVLPYYINSINRKLCLDPVIADANNMLAELPETVPNLKKALRNVMNDAKGTYWWDDKQVDTIMHTFGLSEGYYSKSVNIARSITANLKLGYRGIASIVNMAGGNLHTWIKTGAKFMLKGWQYGQSPEGRQLYAAVRPYLGVASQDIGETKIVKPTFKDFWKPLGLFQAAESFNRKMCFFANYVMAKASGMTDEEARVFGIRGTWAQQFLYNIPALPRMMRSPTGRLMGQFKSYLVHEIQFLTTLSGEEWAKYLIGMWLVGGTRGLIYMIRSIPFLGAFIGFDKVEEILNVELPRLSRGPIGFFPGGGGDISAPGVIQLPSGWSEWLGPTLSDGYNFFKDVAMPFVSGEKFVDKNFAEWGKRLSPALYHWDQLWQSFMTDDGWIKDREGYPMYKVDNEYQQALLALGITPLERSQVSTAERLLKKEEAIRRTSVHKVYVRMANEVEETGKISKDTLEDLIMLQVNLNNLNSILKVYMLKRHLSPKDRRMLFTTLLRRERVEDVYGDYIE